MTDAITAKVLSIIDQIQGAIAAHGADAMNLVYQTTRVEGIGYVVTGFLLLLLSLGVGTFTWWIYKDDEYKSGIEVLLGMAVAIFMISLFFLFYIWNWIAIFDPKLAFAHSVIAKVMN